MVGMLLNKLGISDKASFLLFLKQFIKFGIVGVSSTLINLGTYYALIYIGVHYILANFIAFVVSVCNAYFWNSRYVFSKKRDGSVKPFFKTFIVYSGTFLLGTGLMYCMVDLIGISKWLAPLINLCFTVPLNFLLNKFWAFK